MNSQQQQNNYQKQQQIATDNQQAQGPTLCRNCGHKTLPGADICENCGTWLLEGHCCFCYTAVKPGQKFCGTCGNNPEGNICKACGTHSIFDFCPKCKQPVSRDSANYLQQLNASPQVTEIKALMEVLSKSMEAASPKPKPQVQAPPQDASWLNQLQNYEEQFTDNKAVEQDKTAVSKFSFGKANIDATDKVSNQQPVANTPTASIDEQREALQSKIAALQKQAFADNQQARKFYTGLQISLPELNVFYIKPTRIGWRCNFAGNVHDNPSQCACPRDGGSWIYSEGKQIETITYHDI
ncbi:hypothetical protein BDD43_2477 [Mucilaginibacter gracilis]|uniref:DZANK-type domain-containing protein n=1 Tax=Mucilaginibacter gracilis TaxID=423350 RepID=A0A495J108_9SPHI|nr:zinc ribbon domain-containing protein [Mucilaginibacter gracilis]RKR82301.1 hypothetical protein BDD43_2477 [Mucilaginibacter gracilis]